MDGREWGRWGYWTASLLMSLINVWLVALIGAGLQEPMYQIPLRDGSLLVFSITLVSLSYGSYIRDAKYLRTRDTAKSRHGLWLPGTVIVAICVAYYTIVVLSSSDLLRTDVAPSSWIGVIAAGVSCVYGYSCESARLPREVT